MLDFFSNIRFPAYYSGINQGLVFAVMALGVYLTYKILDYADLTVDGSFATGASVCAMFITNEMNPFLSLIVALIFGALTGLVTSILHTKLRIPSLLSGIITQIALYSINLRIMGRWTQPKSNISLLRVDTVFSIIENKFGLSDLNAQFILLVAIIVVIVAVLCWFLQTEIGFALRATGSNQRMIRALGVNTDNTIIIALVMSNALVALGGALFSMQQGYADITMGSGTIITGLAAVILGDEVFRGKSIPQMLIATVLGSILYSLFIAFAYDLGMPTTDLSLAKALILIVALSLPTTRKRLSKVFKKSTKTYNNAEI